MMNKTNAERILGFDIDLNPIEEKFADGKIYDGYEATSNWEYGTEVAKGKTIDEVLRLLVDTIYKKRSQRVMREQGYRCLACGAINPLEIDHVNPRSKGRDDRMENLRAVCASFTGCRVHERKHAW